MIGGREIEVAAAGAAVMIATHVGLSATRKALFLSEFDIERLPWMVIAASLFSFSLLAWTSAAVVRWTPALAVPGAFAMSGLLLYGEWILAYVSPAVVAIALYLHVAGLGAFLVSGFWSVINEKFDPRTARRTIGRIAAGAALGGLLGGLGAERMVAYFDLRMLLPVLGSLHLAAGAAVYLLAAPSAQTGYPRTTPAMLAGIRVIRRVPYLRNIALLVLATACGAVLVEYVFLAYAADRYSENDLARFLAVFYAATGFGTFLVQTLLSRRVLERFGLAGTVAVLPIALAAGSGALLALPGLWIASTVRGLESVMRSSLFRSGYELLYTPVTVGDKRAAKPFIDVGMDKLGDLAGAGLVALLLAVAAPLALSVMLASALVLGAVALWLTTRLGAGYVDALKGRLVDRAEDLAIGPQNDSVLMRTLAGVDMSRVLGQARSRQSVAPEDDPVIKAMEDLRSGVAARVRARLAEPLDPVLAGQAISLLAWDEVSPDAIKALRTISGRVTGELVDALLNPQSDYAVRRRIPGVLAASPSPRAVGGLVAGLGDARFEVRFRCASALGRLRDLDPTLAMPESPIREAVVLELALSESWTARRARSLDHVFRLLGLMLEPGPIEIAFRGLGTDDPQLRGTALEYLESVLPPAIRDRLWPHLEPASPRPAKTRVSREDARSKLLLSQTSIDVNLAARQVGEGRGE